MRGLMMPFPLTINAIFRHGTRFHADAEIVSRMADRSIHRYTYEEFGARVHQLANALTKLGVKPGDRVATLAWNDFRHLEIYYAVSCMGAVCHTINPRLFQDQLKFIVNDAEDVILLFDNAFVGLVETLSKEVSSVRQYVALCEEKQLPQAVIPNLTAYETLLADQSTDFEWPELDENTAASLCYTSGTTGNPKGVLYSHRSTVVHALMVSGGDWLCLRARDAVLPVVPMFHANAWGIPFGGVMNGCKLIMPGHALDGPSLHELMEQEGATLIAGVPTVWLELLRHLRKTGGRLSSVERVMVGGSACPLSMIEEFEGEYGVQISHGWGMTELSPVGTLGALKAQHEELSAEQRYQIKAKQGRPLFGVELRIVDGDGKTLPHDGKSTGILQARGATVAAAYYRGASPKDFTDDGWFETGDVASIDADGYLQITDRTKDVIKSGGEWISSIELENIAVGHPAVAEAACIAVAHEKWGERPLLLVVPNEGAKLDQKDVLDFFDGKIASWWRPDAVLVVDELPHTATGKLSKLQLREAYKDYRLPAGDK